MGEHMGNGKGPWDGKGPRERLFGDIYLRYAIYAMRAIYACGMRYMLTHVIYASGNEGNTGRKFLGCLWQ